MKDLNNGSSRALLEPGHVAVLTTDREDVSVRAARRKRPRTRSLFLWDDSEPDVAVLLTGLEKQRAKMTIRDRHYLHSYPAGQTHCMQFGSATVVWSRSGNKNLAKFVLGFPGKVFELARLWAPDGHEKNLLTRAISAAVALLVKLEAPDAVVSYADPNHGHHGGVYKAASWIEHGKTKGWQNYFDKDGKQVWRRSFHGFTKGDMESLGYSEVTLPGKIRFVRPLSKRAKRQLARAPLRAGSRSTQEPPKP